MIFYLTPPKTSGFVFNYLCNQIKDVLWKQRRVFNEVHLKFPWLLKFALSNQSSKGKLPAKEKRLLLSVLFSIYHNN